jgi:nicotinamide riboside kinase
MARTGFEERVEEMSAIRIAIMGAESTGKTALGAAIASALANATHVNEVLREWVDAHQRTPEQHEQRAIMEAQIAREEAACAAGYAIVLCDTTPLTIALASQHYFNDDSLGNEAIAHHRRYAHTLVCAPDIPWVADGLQRDGPRVRAAFSLRIDEALTQYGITPILVHGLGEARTAHALAALQWVLES